MHLMQCYKAFSDTAAAMKNTNSSVMETALSEGFKCGPIFLCFPRDKEFPLI